MATKTMNAEEIKTTAVQKGYKVAKLMCVGAGANNNKYFNMMQIDENNYMVVRGRVDSTEIVEGPYSMHQWDKVYHDKTRESKKPKPYTDVTAFFAEKTTKADAGGKDRIGFHSKRKVDVIEFVKLLQAYANKSIKDNYTVSAKNVTKKQVDEAQAILNDITAMVVKGGNVKEANEKLQQLFQIIPRKMSKVQDHLINNNLKTDEDVKEAKRVISEEQATLDVMAGQVAMEEQEVADGVKTEAQKEEYDLLQNMGLDLEEITKDEEKMIKTLLGPNANQFHRAYKAVNNSSEKKYNAWLDRAKVKKTALLWHGSRNENWWSIFQQSLKIRPTNAVLTGAMFGDGIYFADKAQKSIGYTSLDSSYWARGNSSTAILALYEIHQGSQLIIEKHDQSTHPRLNERKMKDLKKDSVFAKGGYDLRNNEYIVYNDAQCTIKYIVQIKK